MADQRIEKNARGVVLSLAGGGRLEGEVFLGQYEARHQGPQRLGDLLNGEERFLPLRTEEGVLLVNLANVISAETDAEGEADELMGLGEKYRIRVTTFTGEEVSAELYVNLPPSCRRVKDALNQTQRFLLLVEEDSIHYLNTDFILSVRD